jgi:hypothetical protein
VLYNHVGELYRLNGRSFRRYLGSHIAVIIRIIQVGVQVEGRLRLVMIYTTIKGNVARVWRSKLASSSSCDSYARSLWSWNQMTTTLLWQSTVWKLLPRMLKVTVGAKIRIDREWRAWIVRQITGNVRIYRELLEVVVVISTLA